MHGFPRIRRRTALTLFAGASALIALPASAHRMHPTEIVASAGHQRVLVRLMLKDLMLLSLRIEPTRSVPSLRQSRSSFHELIEAEGRGNDELLELSKTAPDDLIDRYELVVSLWRDFDGAILDALAIRSVPPGDVAGLLELGGRLGQAMDRLYFGYRESANHYGVTSVLGRRSEYCQHAQVASQKTVAEFFAMAHTGTEAGDVARLLSGIEEVDHRLTVLVDGDPESGVLPAPTPEIRGHLLATRMNWETVRPSLQAVAAGEIGGTADVAAVARAGDDLLDALVESNIMLAGLMPESQRPAVRRFHEVEEEQGDDTGT